MRAILLALLWLTLFVGLVGLPTLLFVSGTVYAPRSFWVEFGVLLGFGLLWLLALQFLLTGRFVGIGAPFGSDTIIQFHKHAGMLVLLLLLAHPVMLIWAEPKFWEFLDPRVNALRTIFLGLASIMMLLLVVLSLWRKWFQLSYDWWRFSHGLMSLGVLGIGMVHAWQVEHYVSGWPKRILLVSIVALAGGSYIYARFGRAWWARQKPYRVKQVRMITPDVGSVTLTPEGHSGWTFRSGQYAWLSLEKSLFTLQQHPYSFSGSSQRAPQELEFTAKVDGQFSQRFIDIQEGALAYLEGPYGSFCIEDDTPGAVFIMGGIGITPAMSILRSLRDQQDTRPMLLLYGNTKQSEITFYDELNELTKQLNLTVVHILSDADKDWTGETGYIDRDVLAKHLTDQHRTYEFFLCGPLPMMDLVERELISLGIPVTHIHSERFDMA